MPLPEETWLSRRSAAIYLTRIGCHTTARSALALSRAIAVAGRVSESEYSNSI